MSEQSVSSAQCDATKTFFSFILPNLTDGSCSHEGVSAPHPILSFPLSFFLFHLVLVSGPSPLVFSAFPHSFLSFFFFFIAVSHFSLSFPFLLLSAALCLFSKLLAVPSRGGSRNVQGLTVTDGEAIFQRGFIYSEIVICI